MALYSGTSAHVKLVILCVRASFLLFQIGLQYLRNQYVRTSEKSFSSDRKWMGVCARPYTRQPSDVSGTFLTLVPLKFDPLVLSNSVPHFCFFSNASASPPSAVTFFQ